MPQKIPLPFYILLGHCEEITEQLGTEEEETKVILEDGAWILLKHQNQRFLWILDPELENLKHHFMMYRNPQILIFLNYHQKGIREHLDDQYRKAKSILKQNKKGKIRVIGFNYAKTHPKMKKLKTTVLEWCIENNNLDYAEYFKGELVGELFEEWED